MANGSATKIVRQFDFRGKLCPYCVMSIIREADLLEAGQALQFLVDDPLALKSVPEELEESENYSIVVDKIDNGWSIIISLL